MKQELASKTRRSILRVCKIDLPLRGHKSGQAVVEYILIVSIAVAFCFILKGAFSSVSNFIDKYIGSYTECLMAHGELPTLGVGNSVTFSDGSGLKEHLSSGFTCNSGFKPFTLAEGRPPIASGSSGGGPSRNASGKGNSSSTSGSSGGEGGSNKNSSNKDKNAGDDEARRNGGGGGGSESDNKPRRAGRGTADGIASAGNSNTRVIEDDSEGDEAGGRGRKRKPRESRIIYRDRQRYKPILGEEAEQLVKNTERSTNKRKPISRSIAKVDNADLSGPRSGLMKPPPEKKVLIEEKREEAWGFGKLLKWLLIIGIIVALVIFFGGQLLNYSNSDS